MSRAATPEGSRDWTKCSADRTSSSAMVLALGDLFNRNRQISVIVEIADDRHCRLANGFRKHFHRKLPLQMLGERDRRR